MQNQNQSNARCIVNFPSDKNGCGYYRTIIPFGYFHSKKNWEISTISQFVFDLNLIKRSHYVRFQRQCTDMQKKYVWEYRRCIDAIKSRCKISFELDDIVHGIEPNNILAYQFYTKSRRDNVLEIMKMSNLVTFSTKFLKHFYQREFGIEHSFVIPNMLPKFLWQPDYNRSKRPEKKKPVVLWAGSASHVGPGGDLEFLVPMIEATIDEFEWAFVGCIPPKLEKYKKDGRITFIKWFNFWEYPAAMQQIKADVAISPIKDSLFNYAKSDLKYLEYSAMNIPAICSSIGNGIGPYDQAGCPNLVKNDPDEWYGAIKDLINDETKYKNSINIQHKYLNNRWLEDESNLALYETAFQI